jgi:hypothetical protein
MARSGMSLRYGIWKYGATVLNVTHSGRRDGCGRHDIGRMHRLDFSPDRTAPAGQQVFAALNRIAAANADGYASRAA